MKILNKPKESEKEKKLKKDANVIYSYYIYNNLKLNNTEKKSLTNLREMKYKQKEKSDSIGFSAVISVAVAQLIFIFLLILNKFYSLSDNFYSIPFIFMVFTLIQMNRAIWASSFCEQEKENLIIKNIVKERGKNFLIQNQEGIIKHIDSLKLWSENIYPELKHYIINDLLQYSISKNNDQFIENLDFSVFQKDIYKEFDEEYQKKLNNKNLLENKKLTEKNVFEEESIIINKQIALMKLKELKK